MTPIFGLITALVAAQLAPTLRSLLTAVLAMMVAGTAVQTWGIASGMGKNPPSTVREVGYWVVQAIIITIVLAVAYGCFALRRRRTAKRGASLERANFTGARGVVAGAMVGTSLLLLAVVAELASFALHVHPGHGNGDIPMTGVVGIVGGLVLLVGLAVALLRDRRGTQSRTAG